MTLGDDGKFLCGRKPSREVLNLVDGICDFITAYHGAIAPVTDTVLLAALDFLLEELTEAKLQHEGFKSP